VDGIERNRAKWGLAGKLWYRLGELASVLFASEVVADAEVIGQYYQRRFRRVPTVITYGASATVRPPGETLARFGLEPRGYVLYVSRFERENNPLGVVQAYLQSSVACPLVMVGDAPYAQDYIAEVHALAAGSPKASQIIFTGYQFGEVYQELQSNCYCYIQATEVGGTHPALVEAMAYGNAVIANGTPENREVVGDAGIVYEKNDFQALATKLDYLCANPAVVDHLRVAAQARAEASYSWDAITDAYERLFYQLAQTPQRRGYHAISGRLS
jgi:glycosyltransferase involved in cell wall biosynthesis